MRFQKYPDTCGRGLNLQWEIRIRWWTRCQPKNRPPSLRPVWCAGSPVTQSRLHRPMWHFEYEPDKRDHKLWIYIFKFIAIDREGLNLKYELMPNRKWGLEQKTPEFRKVLNLPLGKISNNKFSSSLRIGYILEWLSCYLQAEVCKHYFYHNPKSMNKTSKQLEFATWQCD